MEIAIGILIVLVIWLDYCAKKALKENAELRKQNALEREVLISKHIADREKLAEKFNSDREKLTDKLCKINGISPIYQETKPTENGDSNPKPQLSRR